jgi:hypothetical protein
MAAAMAAAMAGARWLRAIAARYCCALLLPRVAGAGWLRGTVDVTRSVGGRPSAPPPPSGSVPGNCWRPGGRLPARGWSGSVPGNCWRPGGRPPRPSWSGSVPGNCWRFAVSGATTIGPGPLHRKCGWPVKLPEGERSFADPQRCSPVFRQEYAAGLQNCRRASTVLQTSSAAARRALRGGPEKARGRLFVLRRHRIGLPII